MGRMRGKGMGGFYGCCDEVFTMTDNDELTANIIDRQLFWDCQTQREIAARRVVSGM